MMSNFCLHSIFVKTLNNSTMKKTFRYLASLTLGFMVASCQNGLEEVINESEVQDELATTRAEDEPTNEIEASMLRGTTTDLSISGYPIISGINEVTYTASPTGSYYIDWDYDTSVLYETGGGDGTNSITLKLINQTNTNDTYLSVYLRNSSSTGQIEEAKSIDIGCNGPVAGTSSVQIIRLHDNVEVYPALIGLSPNTSYCAYFSNTQTSIMTLQWLFSYATLYSQNGYMAYFQTDNNGYAFLTVNGKMPDSSVYKNMLGVTLYGEIASNKNNEEKEGEELSEDEK